MELILTGLDESNLANEVTVVRDGKEALDYLNSSGKFAGRPDGYPTVVLLDLKLPKMSGLQVLEQMKCDEQLKRIPVVILTSSRED
jgi:CheY-like chemotaxis protein